MLCCSKINSIWLVAICCITACGPSKKLQSFSEKPVLVIKNTVVTIDSVNRDTFLEHLLASNPILASVLSHRKEWNTQIIYTQIDRGGNGVPSLTDHYFNVDPTHYFYPASTVKFPVSLLALQRLNELKEKGIDKNTTMITEAVTGSQTAVYNDPSSPDGRPTIAQYIRKILMVSDNDAYNRLYEFLGQDYINKTLQQKGYDDVQFLHRLQIPLSELENRQTNPVKFIDTNNNVLYEQAATINNSRYSFRKDSLGNSYYQGGNLINGAMDFSGKNRISLQDLHSMLISLVFPNKVPINQRFNITEADRLFVLKYMSQYPTESTNPSYLSDTSSYWPAYGKYLLLGSEKGIVPKNIRIFNKIGGAYGQLLDVAYIVDFENGVEFFLSVVTYCNSDGVINDDKYDYNTIGLPFMKQLGQTIYNYEVKRSKKFLPNLNCFKFIYDK